MKYTEIAGGHVINEITLILTERDGVEPTEASDRYKEFILYIRSMMDNDIYLDIEDALRDDFGLEPDYLGVVLNDLGNAEIT